MNQYCSAACGAELVCTDVNVIGGVWKTNIDATNHSTGHGEQIGTKFSAVCTQTHSSGGTLGVEVPVFHSVLRYVSENSSLSRMQCALVSQHCDAPTMPMPHAGCGAVKASSYVDEIRSHMHTVRSLHRSAIIFIILGAAELRRHISTDSRVAA